MKFNPLVNHKQISENVFNRKKSIEKAIHLLNHKDTQHPPDTFFIRRNSVMLNKYLDKTEYDFLKTKASEEFRPNYDHFKLKYTDREKLRCTKRHWK